MFRTEQTFKIAQRLSAFLFPDQFKPDLVSVARPSMPAQSAVSRRQRRRSRYGSESTARTTWY